MNKNSFNPPYNKSQVDDRYICKSCNNIFKNTHQAKCGCRYCESCSVLIKDDELPLMVCKLCNHSIENDSKYPDKAFQKEVDNLDISCVECNWRGNFKTYPQHYSNHSVEIDINQVVVNHDNNLIKTKFEELNERTCMLEMPLRLQAIERDNEIVTCDIDYFIHQHDQKTSQMSRNLAKGTREYAQSIDYLKASISNLLNRIQKCEKLININ